MRKSNRKEPAWKYGTEVEEAGGEKKGYLYIECNFCKKVVKGGVKRMKEHLACTRKNVIACPNVPDEVKKEIGDYMKSGIMQKQLAHQQFDDMVDLGSYFGKQNDKGEGSMRGIRGPMDIFVTNVGDEDEASKKTLKMTKNVVKEMRQKVSLDVGRFFFENAIPFNVVESPSFVNMCRSIGSYGRGYKPPSIYDLRTWILREEGDTTQKIVDDIKKTWSMTGVSILSDGWSDMRNRSLINIIVNNPHGNVFLKSIDASAAIKDSDMLFMLLDDVVEEIGEGFVVQIVTDNAAAYKAAGRKLMEKRKNLYWTPCAAHCLDLMLEKLGQLPQHKNALIKAKKVTNFIYNHSWVLALMRKIVKKELLRPGATRFATAYLTLQRIYELKNPLQSMFTSEEWVSSSWANKPDGKEVKKILLKDNIFWPSVAYALKTTNPLVKVLRLVDGEKVPAMGFIYGAMDTAKEEIAKNLGNKEASYKEIWDIIDEKWEFQMHCDLHATAYYLNPQFQYDENFSTHVEVKRGLYNCMERLISNPKEREDANLQLDDFVNKKNFFGLELAKSTCKKRSPVDWWTQFGDGTPELTHFAIRVLSLTCSSSACERNWSTFNQVHTKRRNRLTASRLNNLVYVIYNKKLKDRHVRLRTLKEDEDPLIIETIPSDDEWIVGDVQSDANTNENLNNSEGEKIERSTQKQGQSIRKRTFSQREKGKGKRPLRLRDEEDEWIEVDSDEDDILESRLLDDDDDDDLDDPNDSDNNSSE